ncbi:MAG: hypothetical protein J2P46_09380 [Zavarzinella sp.]|nr:hypothetical protein [Zavarzinella sp.]
MEQDLEAQLRQRIAELEKENAYLKGFNELLQTQRKEYLDIILGPPGPEDPEMEKQLIEMMKNHVPGSGLKFLAELGIYPVPPK